MPVVCELKIPATTTGTVLNGTGNVTAVVVVDPDATDCIAWSPICDDAL